MAEVKDIFGNYATGKVGTVSLYQLRGKTIMRSLPVKRREGRTENQLRNQNRFGEIRKFCNLFKKVLIPQIWNDVATTSSGYHLFMKTNSAAFDKDGILTDPAKVVLSMGKLTLPKAMQAQRTVSGSNTISLKWENEPELGGSTLRDKLMVISSGDGKYSDIEFTRLTRRDLNGTFELPELASAASCIYLFFESIDQRYYSQSICLAI